MNNILYHVRSVSKKVSQEGEDILILRDISCDIYSGSSISIIGASGSGKSTFLHLLGLLDIPSSGVIAYKGKDVAFLSKEERGRLLQHDIGFIFQHHHLLPEFSVVENVILRARLAGYNPSVAYTMSCEALEQVGLSDKASQRVTTLSGGEKQRVSIARAIVTTPNIILADEPTGSLDPFSAEHVIDVLQSLRLKNNTTLVMVTHNMQLASLMEYRFILEKGVLQDA